MSEEKTTDSFQTKKYGRTSAFFGLFVTGIAAAVALGVFCNAMNFLVCREYYVAVLRWRLIPDEELFLMIDERKLL
ncbi:MAG: hypothetical protein LBQ54_11910 [Planctomycetaceae bacterium]|jgi:hypothetical protein|nr:hypothetical protein [Planctomycetaceae bacterium]